MKEISIQEYHAMRNAAWDMAVKTIWLKIRIANGWTLTSITTTTLFMRKATR